MTPPHSSTVFPVTNVADIPSPALLIHRERIDENLRRMITIAGGPARLRPHIKTHKMAEIVRRQRELGIDRVKCATIAEAEMAAAAGVPDVLLALQPVGPNVGRLFALRSTFPGTHFSAVVDDLDVVRDIARQVKGPPVDLLIDLDIGQHRTGVPAGDAAMACARLLSSTPGVAFGGLHAYDGHLHDADPESRRIACEAAFAPVLALQRALELAGIPAPRVVAGGTPTFPFHALRAGVECSPGTCVLWDAGYTKQLPDLPFLPAALLLGRIVSRPLPNRLCLDLGHKAVASEMPHPRVVFPDIPDAKPVGHNEEHLVLETAHAAKWRVGDAVFGVPWHVCPTVALHAEAWVVHEGIAAERWPIAARARRLTI